MFLNNTLRVATATDGGPIAALAIAFRNHLQRTEPTDASLLASVHQLLASPEAEFDLCLQDGVAVGYVLLRFRHSLWASGTDATLEDLFVHPATRQGGVGRALVEFALQRAKARGCTSMALDTNEHNEASQRIYRSLGFQSHSPRWGGNQLFYRLKLR
jgi:ribosomal protein S18 acetylase RimI-like enzyme